MTFNIDELTLEALSDPVRQWNNRKLTDLGPLIDEENDPNVLFRHNWLARGQAFALVASAGVGKSSMTDQMALHWTLGKAFLAEPTRPLKIAVVQFEDSDRDLQEQRDGMIRGLMSEGMSETMIDKAFSGVVFPTDFIGLYGDDFTKRLSDYQHDFKFDLLFLNPLQRCFGDDVSDQAAVSRFCANLDTILKSPECPCAAGIVMHTPKFHSGVKDNRQSVDDFAEYAMAGSQEWTAWIRAVINFQKHGTSEDYFDVKASKRGKRLGWKDQNGNPITKRIFKHSDGFIYWQEVTDSDEIASIPEAEKPKAKKDVFRADACAVQICRRLVDDFGFYSASPHCRNALCKDVYRIIKPLGRSYANAEAVIDTIFNSPENYGVRVVKHPKYSGETLALEEGDERGVW